MKKITNISLILLATLLFSGCTNQYIIGRNGNGEEYIGALTNKDLVHSRIQLHNLKSKQTCAGDVYLSPKATKDDYGQKFIEGISNISCSDKKVIEINWEAKSLQNWAGSGIDQFNNKYEFEVVSKKAFNNLTEEKTKYTIESYETLHEELVKF